MLCLLVSPRKRDAFVLAITGHCLVGSVCLAHTHTHHKHSMYAISCLRMYTFSRHLGRMYVCVCAFLCVSVSNERAKWSETGTNQFAVLGRVYNDDVVIYSSVCHVKMASVGFAKPVWKSKLTRQRWRKSPPVTWRKSPPVTWRKSPPVRSGLVTWHER